jgi:hypothetical protein
MNIINYNHLETQILDAINKGQDTYDEILNYVDFNDKTFLTVLEGLISKHVIKFDNKTGKYGYDTKIDGEMIILDGNYFLPATFIKLDDKLIVSRGEWYEFQKDFDIRRIIWNIKLDFKTDSTLVDLIKSATLKEKKTKIVQLPEYENLRNKIVPYTPNIGFLIHTVGEYVTDISIIFKIKLSKSDICVEHRGFTVRSEIATQELIEQLNKPVAERNYVENISINKLFLVKDFVFSKNDIPISLINEELIYAKITGIKNNFELTYYKLDSLGNTKKIDVESFDEVEEFNQKLQELLLGYPSKLLSSCNFCIESEIEN